MTLVDLKLKDRVAIVTGGSRGIGRAIVELLASVGCNVVVNYIADVAAANATVAAARAAGVKAIAVQADISKTSESAALIEGVIKSFGRVDILVCNAGIWEGSPVELMDEAQWDRTMDVNLKGTWSVCRAVVPAMKQQRFGKIVILSSTAGQRGEANYSNYAASKGAQIAFTKSLAVELGEWGINVNAVAPGWVMTDMTSETFSSQAERERMAAGIPIGAVAVPEDIAGPVVFLCSDWARHITGETLSVNGGAVLCS